jgi:hypothetical protein
VAVLDDVQDLDEVIGEPTVGPEESVEVLKLLLVRQVSVKKKINHFLESGLFR